MTTRLDLLDQIHDNLLTYAEGVNHWNEVQRHAWRQAYDAVARLQAVETNRRTGDVVVTGNTTTKQTKMLKQFAEDRRNLLDGTDWIFGDSRHRALKMWKGVPDSQVPSDIFDIRYNGPDADGLCHCRLCT